MQCCIFKFISNIVYVAYLLHTVRIQHICKDMQQAYQPFQAVLFHLSCSSFAIMTQFWLYDITSVLFIDIQSVIGENIRTVG